MEGRQSKSATLDISGGKRLLSSPMKWVLRISITPMGESNHYNGIEKNLSS
jgi:hypothetical protein